jgi:sugar phosphate isomerase/epimerase
MSLTRFSINQATLKYSSLPEVIDAVREVGASAIGVWRETVQELGASEVATRLADAGVRASSLCRGGFFTSPDPTAWRAALDDNRRAIEETAAIGAPALVLVAGGLPDGSRDLVCARQRVRDAIGELEADAQAAGVVLAIEPLHPMYAADRAVISTLAQALDIAEQFSPVGVGVVVDTFHVWWDPELAAQVARAGRGGRIASYQGMATSTSRRSPAWFGMRATRATSRSRSSTRKSGMPTAPSSRARRPSATSRWSFRTSERAGTRDPSRPR